MSYDALAEGITRRRRPRARARGGAAARRRRRRATTRRSDAHERPALPRRVPHARRGRQGPGRCPRGLVEALDLAVAQAAAGALPGDRRAAGAGPGHRAGAAAPLRARRRRAPARPGGDRPHRHPARAPARARADADDVARARRVAVDGVRHRRPAEVRRRRGRRARVGAPRRCGAAGASRSSRSAPAAERLLPPRTGRGALAHAPALAEGVATDGARPRPARPRAAPRSGRSRASPGLIVVVSDFRGPRDWRARWARWRAATPFSRSRSATRARRRCPPSGTWRSSTPRPAARRGRHLLAPRCASASPPLRGRPRRRRRRAAARPRASTSCSPPRATGCARWAAAELTRPREAGPAGAAA